MRTQRARRGRGGGGEGVSAAVAQLVRCLESGMSPERYQLIARKAQVVLGWARPNSGESNVDWLCRQIPAVYHRPVLESLGYTFDDATTTAEPETPAVGGPQRSRRRSRQGR